MKGWNDSREKDMNLGSSAVDYAITLSGGGAVTQGIGSAGNIDIVLPSPRYNAGNFETYNPLMVTIRNTGTKATGPLNVALSSNSALPSGWGFINIFNQATPRVETIPSIAAGGTATFPVTIQPVLMNTAEARMYATTPAPGPLGIQKRRGVVPIFSVPGMLAPLSSRMYRVQWMVAPDVSVRTVTHCL
ncbi:hypothetical protein AGMMS49579_17440 [Spirochaetia bacterium]|nr:hypothetical protein AGMMS49579_17440 [Spirochaetia bacterium]